MGSMKSALPIAAAAAAAMALAAFTLSPGIDSWFVADDFWHLAYAEFLSTPIRSWRLPQFGNMAFRPLTFSLNFAQIKTLGSAPAAVHGTDMALHVLNTLLVFVLSLKFARVSGPDRSRAAAPAAFAAAAVFAVHPVSALTATWFACRADLVAAACSLGVLIVAAGRERKSAYSLAGAALLAFGALSAKVTHGPLFIAVAAVALATTGGDTRKERMLESARRALAVLNAAIVYVCLRLLVLDGMGGYAPFPSSALEFLAQVQYHVPRVYGKALVDVLAHDVTRDAALFWPLVFGGALLLLAGGAAAIARSRAALAAGAVVFAVMVAPAWNLSHMFALREERLLYFPLVGLCLLIAATAASPSSRLLRMAAAAGAAFFALSFVPHSRQEVVEWGRSASRNKSLTEAMAEHLDKPGGGKGALRYYVLGLPSDSYFFDPMVKLGLGEEYLDRAFLPADQEAFLWLPPESELSEKMPGEPERAFPKVTVRPSDPEVRLATATPPDLLSAVRHDPMARVLQWNGVTVADITPHFIYLEKRRKYFQRRAEFHPGHLPSFSFRERPMPLDWELSPGLEAEGPRRMGEPRVFDAKNDDPYLVSPGFDFHPLMAGRLEIEMILPETLYLPPGRDRGCVSWLTREEKNHETGRQACFELVADGEPRTYTIDLFMSPGWAASEYVTRLRLDPVSYPGTFRLVRLEFNNQGVDPR